MVNKEEKNMVDSKAGNFETDEYDEINLYDLWKVIVKRKKIIIAIFLISLLSATIYCFTVPKIYRLETYMKLYIPKDIITVKEVTAAKYMPKDIFTVKEAMTAKEVVLIIGKIDDEKKVIIFPKTPDEITEAEIVEMKGAIDKFKITIESSNRENLPAALHEMVTYIENIREIKSTYEKIISEINERMKFVNEADKKSDFYIKAIEKKFNNAKSFPITLDPVTSIIKSIDLKMEKNRLEREHQNYKLIQPLGDPFISKEPVWPKKAMIITIAGICSLIFGIFIVFIAEYFEGMKKKTQSK